ncbi:hypothetical protein NVP1083O_32 [Vibrio phage 1.083.O._10N.286.52.B9]|nr:hypothetical protein NVP1083O_32 [Vibrio phage 1.083.O._10N.286.52.B9]
MQSIDTISPTIQQLVWLNKSKIKRVFASTKRASNGALIVQQVLIPSGLPIEIGTLDGWMTKADFESLVNHNMTKLTEFTITMGDLTFEVIWDNTSVAIVGDDLYAESNGCDTLTNVVMKFLTV